MPIADAAAAVSGDAAQQTLQLAFLAAVYAASIPNLGRTSLAGDMVFGDNADAQIAAQRVVMTRM